MDRWIDKWNKATLCFLTPSNHMTRQAYCFHVFLCVSQEHLIYDCWKQEAGIDGILVYSKQGLCNPSHCQILFWICHLCTPIKPPENITSKPFTVFLMHFRDTWKHGASCFNVISCPFPNNEIKFLDFWVLWQHMSSIQEASSKAFFPIAYIQDKCTSVKQAYNYLRKLLYSVH